MIFFNQRFIWSFQTKHQPRLMSTAFGSCQLNSLFGSLSVLQVSGQDELQSGGQPGRQLVDGVPVPGARPAPLPVLHLLRGSPQAPLLRTRVLRPLLRPDRQHGLRGHRGSVGVPLPHVQVRPAAGGPGPLRLGVPLRALWCPAGTREPVGVKGLFWCSASGLQLITVYFLFLIFIFC